MKKLLVFMFIISIVPLANAGLVFTVDGQEAGPEITLYPPSSTVVLGLKLTEGDNIKAYQMTYTLSNEQAEFLEPPDWTNLDFSGWQSDAPGKVNSYDSVGVCTSVEIAASNLFSTGTGPLTLMTGLILHGLDATPVTLTVTTSGPVEINGEVLPQGTVLHTLNIIPEPATIALLGLGGFWLRKRGKIGV